MKSLTTLLVSALCMLAMTATAQTEKLPAFPGAEGFGKYTTGGRGGNVYHVTSLEDSNAKGTLRWANAQKGPRTIVFDVSGTIFLKSGLKIANNTTLAGQTAPGDGICVADYPLTLGSNVICRYMRFRLGNAAIVKAVEAWAAQNGYTATQVFNNKDLLDKVTMPHEGDGLGSMDENNIVVDHCSVSWSIDECLSVYGGRNLTVQWCISSQSLVNAGHSKGSHGYGGNWGGAGSSFHHNLIAHHTSRTPRLGPRQGTQTDERMDMRNNVIYNWGGNGCYGGEGMKVNIVNNYYKPGPATKSRSTAVQQRIAGIGIRTSEYTEHDTAKPNGWDLMWHVWGKFYVTGNKNSLHSQVTDDNWTYGMYNQISNDASVDYTYTQVTKDTMRIDEPIPFVAVTTHTADQAYDRVLKYVGASLHRDALDEIIISDVTNGQATFTGSGNNSGFINSQDDVKSKIPTLWPELAQGEAEPDTDGDGMPDSWENAHGLNANDAADGNQTGADGYTNLENYLNAIVADITAAQYEGGEPMGYIEEVYVPGEDSEPGKTVIGSGSVNWMLDKGTAGQTATTEEAIADKLVETSVVLGSTLSYGGTQKTNGGGTLTKFQTSKKNESQANDGNAVSFNVTVADGYYFRPTKIGFHACKCGTDGGTLDVYWKNADGKKEIELAFNPERNNNYSAYEKEVYDIASASGTSSLLCHIRSLDTSKALAIGNVTITGEVKSESSGIGEIRMVTLGDTRFYNLQGLPVDQPLKGIYLHNGKKVIVGGRR